MSNIEQSIHCVTIDEIKDFKIDVFRRDTMTGYQRKVNTKRVNAIAKFINECLEKKEDIFFPPIIVAKRTFDDDDTFYIVDGQHRKEGICKAYDEATDPTKKKKISEIPLFVQVINILNSEAKFFEHETFIKVNQEAKKVDTSLAMLVKKVKMDSSFEQLDLDDKIFFMLLDVASLFDSEEGSILLDKISLDPGERKSLSLNAFYKATNKLIKIMLDSGIVDEENISDENFPNTFYEWLNDILREVNIKWGNVMENNVLFKAIGFNAVCIFSAFSISKEELELVQAKGKIISDIKSVRIYSNMWNRGNEYSKYSSESGYTKVAISMIENSILKEKMKKRQNGK